ncbi:MAG: hypothetical protein K2P31_00230 [Rickettsiaceae bacterium]|nr:hypothetical protein [Rickettsiaceae bacterium]
MTSYYNEIMLELSDYARELSLGYIDSWGHEEKTREAAFAKRIISTFYKYRSHLALMSKMHRRDLEDCIQTHKNKYLSLFEANNFSKSEIAQYLSEIKEIIFSIKTHAQGENLERKEVDIVSQLVYKITHNAQVLFAEQSHNQLAKDTILASAIVYQIKSLDSDNQNKLLDRLLLIKEIWNIENAEEGEKETIKYKFYQNLASFIDTNFIDNIEAAFDQIISFFVIKSSVLEQLTDLQLIHLYDRLKNSEQINKLSPQLLDTIHTESQYRYSYNRLGDSGYELLSRFQNLDALTHQIEGFEFATVELHLLHNTNFLSQYLQLLLKQADNIRAFGLAKNDNLLAIIKKIDTKIRHLSVQEQQTIKSALTSFRGKLGNALEGHIQKRFVELDKYTINSLTTKYRLLLENMLHLFEDDALGRKFLREGFVTKLASSFYFPNLSNSVDKIRKMAEDKKEVRAQLLELNLSDIFLHPGVLNKITSLDFKKVALNPEIKSPSDFVHALVKHIISVCSAFQLEILYKPLLGLEDLTPLQIYLREEVAKEVRQRTSVAKMMYSIVSGRKKEYDRLGRIKRKEQEGGLSKTSIGSKL